MHGPSKRRGTRVSACSGVRLWARAQAGFVQVMQAVRDALVIGLARLLLASQRHVVLTPWVTEWVNASGQAMPDCTPGAVTHLDEGDVEQVEVAVDHLEQEGLGDEVVVVDGVRRVVLWGWGKVDRCLSALCVSNILHVSVRAAGPRTHPSRSTTAPPWRLWDTCTRSQQPAWRVQASCKHFARRQLRCVTPDGRTDEVEDVDLDRVHKCRDVAGGTLRHMAHTPSQNTRTVATQADTAVSARTPRPHPRHIHAHTHTRQRSGHAHQGWSPLAVP